MWLELAGAGAAWLAHFAWYAGRVKRQGLLVQSGFPVARFAPWAIAACLLLISLSSACWIGAHGIVLGIPCVIAALTSAASFNAIVAPLAPRAVLAASTLAALALVVGSVGWIHGA